MNSERSEAIARADGVIDKTAELYPKELAANLSDLQKAIDADDCAAASRIVQNIAGEARSFGWPAVCDAAKLLRDLLDADEFPKKHDACLVALQTLQTVFLDGPGEAAPETLELLDQIRHMTTHLGAK